MTVRDCHNRAMELAELALLARMRGSRDEAANLSRQALAQELAAIEEMEASDKIEPTYSVLHRSAATLALDCDDYREAERLAAKALAHNPQHEIAEELRDLLEQVNFRRHLSLRGVTLNEDELQMNLTGPAVGFGYVRSADLLNRIENASRMIYRTVERRRALPFREKGRPAKALRNDYELFVSTPRAASFSVTLKLGQPMEQQRIPGFVDASAVVDEILELMELANRAAVREIRERIPDPAYFRNFMALAKRIAPDGENVTQVGFTVSRLGRERSVQVTRPAPVFPQLPADGHDRTGEEVTVRGVLLFADATQAEAGLIKIVEEESKDTHEVKVPEGMMADIVRPMWDSVVVVTGHWEGRRIALEDIQEADPQPSSESTP